MWGVLCPCSDQPQEAAVPIPTPKLDAALERYVTAAKRVSAAYTDWNAIPRGQTPPDLVKERSSANGALRRAAKRLDAEALSEGWSLWEVEDELAERGVRLFPRDCPGVYRAHIERFGEADYRRVISLRAKAASEAHFAGTLSITTCVGIR
jgi:hypothetical protein